MAVLDFRVLRALSSPTRLRIIRRLRSMRMTLSDLSASFRMHPSTIKGHLDLLAGAGLVRMEDDGRKWKYYSLTPVGVEVSSGGELRVALPALLGVASLFASARGLQNVGMDFSAGVSRQELAYSAASKAAEYSAPGAVQGAATQPAFFPLLFTLIGFALVSFSVVLWLRIRKTPACP